MEYSLHLESGGLAALYDEEEGYKLRARRAQGKGKRAKIQSPPRECNCVVCGEYFETRHPTQSTCLDDECREARRIQVQRDSARKRRARQ